MTRLRATKNYKQQASNTCPSYGTNWVQGQLKQTYQGHTNQMHNGQHGAECTHDTPADFLRKYCISKHAGA